MKKRLFPLFAVGFLLAGNVIAQDQVIDFETLPDGTPATEGMLIHDQYAPWGVTFQIIGLAPEQGPKVATVGAPKTAFLGPNRNAPSCGISTNSTADMMETGQEVGCFFLTDDNIHNNSYFGLRVDYLTPVFRAYGELLDIDATESWEVRALGATDELLASQVYSDGDPGTGDGIATGWYFDLAEPIHAIELIPSTGLTHQFGLAFDNFSPSSIPHFPVCDAGGPYQGDAGVPVQFDGSGSHDTDGEVVAWHWEFGDGESSDEMSPLHTYAADGTYTVVLTVTDNDGNQTSCSPEDVVPSQVTDWGSLKAQFK